MNTESARSLPPIRFSQRRSYTQELAISFLMQQAVENPQVISLAAGLVDPSTLPLQDVLQSTQEMLSSPAAGRAALQYGTTAGYIRLRRLLLAHFAQMEHAGETDLGIDVDNLILTTGSQQLLSLVCEILFDPGDICLVAGPTYFVFAGNLAGVGARAITVAADEHGLRTDSLEQTLERLQQQNELDRVKLIYVVSYYDNPGGTCLSATRRQELVNIAQRWSQAQRIMILEDAAYRELRYDGPEYPSIWASDASRQHVIYTQTFSKTFSPGLRVGYGIVPRELVAPLCDWKGNEDFGSSNFAQHLIADMLQAGRYERHLEDVKRSYRNKREAMLAAAEEHFRDLPEVSWHSPHGGLYVWMSLPTDVPTGFSSRLFTNAVNEGVMYVPGEICYAGDHPPRHQMRLSYGVQTAEGIALGMQRLARAIRKTMSETMEAAS